MGETDFVVRLPNEGFPLFANQIDQLQNLGGGARGVSDFKDIALKGAIHVTERVVNAMSRYVPTKSWLSMANWASGGLKYYLPANDTRTQLENIFLMYARYLSRISVTRRKFKNRKAGLMLKRNNLFFCHAVLSATGNPLLVFHAAMYPEDLSGTRYKALQANEVEGRKYVPISKDGIVFHERNAVYDILQGDLFIVKNFGQPNHPFSHLLQGDTVDSDIIGSKVFDVNYFPKEIEQPNPDMFFKVFG
eukprot:732560_1